MHTQLQFLIAGTVSFVVILTTWLIIAASMGAEAWTPSAWGTLKRSTEYCERWRKDDFMITPANALSNFVFVFYGVITISLGAFDWQAHRHGPRPGFVPASRVNRGSTDSQQIEMMHPPMTHTPMIGPLSPRAAASEDSKAGQGEAVLPPPPPNALRAHPAWSLLLGFSQLYIGLGSGFFHSAMRTVQELCVWRT